MSWQLVQKQDTNYKPLKLPERPSGSMSYCRAQEISQQHRKTNVPKPMTKSAGNAPELYKRDIPMLHVLIS